jgi:acyl-coenzyme A synthetase/AMP-(fatty) acid ligase
MSCYFKVDRDFEEGERIPIGRPFDRTGLFLFGDDGKIADNEGEICLFGDCLTLGYDGDRERTDAAFVTMRCEDGVERRVYRTGDLALRNARGELEYLGRRDGQIKRMGHRIELGEIEAVALTFDKILQACCVYNDDEKKIVLFYVGDAADTEIFAYMRTLVPRYMLPAVAVKLDAMPLTANGKLDRKGMKDRAKEL